MIKNALILSDCFGVAISSFLPEWFYLYFDKEKSHELVKRYCPKGDLGELSMDDAINDLIEVQGLKNKTKGEIIKEWLEIAKPKYDNLNIYKELKKYNHICLVSNAWKDMVEMIVKYYKLDLYEYFDGVFISYKYRVAKPDLKFYNIVLKESDYQKYDKCFMIDDHIEALVNIEKIGIKPIVYKDISTLNYFLNYPEEK